MLYGNPKFPRRKCESCGALCRDEQTAQYSVQTTQGSRVATFCTVMVSGAPGCGPAAEQHPQLRAERLEF